jgi:uncharacterized DUF497 family protein
MENPPWEAHDFRIIFGTTEAVCDENKEVVNRIKHKYSLASAEFFLERRSLPVPQPPYAVREVAPINGEIRHEHMTVDTEGNIIFFVTTMRKNEKVRVVSLRKASNDEIKVFEHHTGFRMNKD